jgi:large subunit ribosomal protein L15
MRLPKLRGFKSHRAPAEAVKVGQLEAVKRSTIDNQVLFEAGLVSSPYSIAKLLSGGELKAKKEVKLQAASASAIKAIEKAGGSFSLVERRPQPAAKLEQ